MGMLHDLGVRMAVSCFRFFFLTPFFFFATHDGPARCQASAFGGLATALQGGAYMYRFLYDTNDWDADNMGLCSGALDKRSKWL